MEPSGPRDDTCGDEQLAVVAGESCEDSTGEGPVAGPGAPPAGRRLGRPLLLGLLLGFLAVAAVLAVRGRSLTTLTRQRFDAARELWRDAGPASYRIEVQTVGRQAATYRVEVREGRVVTAERNGVAVSQPRVRGTWSVPGMFDTIASDVATLDAPRESRAGPPLSLHWEIDPRLGVPRQYVRVERTPVGANPDSGWRVILFEPLP